MPNNRRDILRAASGITIAALTGRVQAAEYPVRPVRLIVPYGAGSAADVVARAVAEVLSQKWRQNVLVDNRPGASGMLGLQALKSAKSDGYDLALGDTGTLTINPSYFAQVPYDPDKDFSPAVDFFSAGFIVWVRKNSHKTLRDLIQAAKANPGKLNYASTGPGSLMYLGNELLKHEAGLKIQEVPFKEMGPLLASFANGDVDVVMATLPSVQSILDRIQPLAVTSAARVSEFPDIPTVEEAAGLKGFNYTAWSMLIAPKGTPGDILQKIRVDVVEAFQRPDVKQKMKAMGLETSKGLAPDVLSRQIRDELGKYKEVIAASRKS